MSDLIRRVKYIVFEPATGQIVATGTCSAGDMHLQGLAIAGTDVMEGEADDIAHVVIDRKVIERAEEAAPEPDVIDARSRAAEVLAATDWYVTRLAETGKPIPPEVTVARAAAREALSGQ